MDKLGIHRGQNIPQGPGYLLPQDSKLTHMSMVTALTNLPRRLQGGYELVALKGVRVGGLNSQGPETEGPNRCPFAHPHPD